MVESGDGDPVNPKLPTLFNRKRNSGPKAGATKARGKGKRQLETRARWIIHEWTRDPTYTYAEMVDAVRERFECGFSAAEHAYTRAGEMEAEMLATVTPGRLINLYFELLDEARAAGKFNAARAIIDSIFDKTGMSAPTKHDFTVSGARTMHQMAHVNVLSMTPNQRATRERELLAKARGAAVIDVGADGRPAAPPDDVPPTMAEAVQLLDQIAGPSDDEDGGDE